MNSKTRVVIQEGIEGLTGQNEYLTRLDRKRRGGAGTAVESRELANELPASLERENDLAPGRGVSGDLDPAGANRKDCPARFALSEERAAGRV